jgi:hypothetical protein
VQRLRLWTPARFAAQCHYGGTRGDLCTTSPSAADQAADAERALAAAAAPGRDLVLPDQLAVTADDLGRGRAAGAARAATAHLLLHRRDLLEEEVPPARRGPRAGRRLAAGARNADIPRSTGQKACPPRGAPYARGVRHDPSPGSLLAATTLARRRPTRPHAAGHGRAPAPRRSTPGCRPTPTGPSAPPNFVFTDGLDTFIGQARTAPGTGGDTRPTAAWPARSRWAPRSRSTARRSPARWSTTPG